MYSKLVFFLSSFAIYCTAMAQTGYDIDSINLSGNTDMVFYSLEGSVKNKISKKTWDIGFGNEKHESGIKINDLGGVRLWKTNKDTASFSLVTLADTTNEKFNSPSYHFKGAFDATYQVLNASNDYQIGWGVQYLSLGNIISGDSVFIIKCMDGNYRKLFIKYRLSPERRYIIRVANIDNSNSHEWIVRKNFDSTTLYTSCFNMATETQVNNTEPNYNSYDLIFRDYTIGKSKYPMSIMLNNTYSLLNNLKAFNGDTVYKNFRYVTVPAYEVSNTPISSASYNNSLITPQNFTDNNYIGINWLNTGTNTAKPDYSYFVRDRNGCIWHLAVKEYKSSTNEVVFYKKKLSVCHSDVKNLDLVNNTNFNVYPNPAKSSASIFLEVNESNFNGGQFRIYNTQGLLVQEGNVDLKNEINTGNMSSGIYLLMISDFQNRQNSIKKIIIE